MASIQRNAASNGTAFAVLRMNVAHLKPAHLKTFLADGIAYGGEEDLVMAKKIAQAQDIIIHAQRKSCRRRTF